MKSDSQLILSLYPNTRGLGYVCIEMPQKLMDFGVITIRPICNDRIVSRVQKFIEFHQPKIIVIRDGEALSTPRGKRITALIEKISREATVRHIAVHRYSRRQMRDVFEQFGATTKYEIAKKIISWFPELAIRAPKIRKPWMDEDYNMGIFDALSLAYTHEYLTE